MRGALLWEDMTDEEGRYGIEIRILAAGQAHGMGPGQESPGGLSHLRDAY